MPMVIAKQKSIVHKQPCTIDEFCIERQSIDRLNTIMQSEKICRNNLQICRTEKMTIETTGWDPSIVLVVIGAVLVVGFGGGYLIGTL